MSAPPVSIQPILRDELIGRRGWLQQAASAPVQTAEVARLLREVDAALGRIDAETYGLCETCHEPIEADRLLADPLTRVCLDHLTPAEARALQQDSTSPRGSSAGCCRPARPASTGGRRRTTTSQPAWSAATTAI